MSITTSDARKAARTARATAWEARQADKATRVPVTMNTYRAPATALPADVRKGIDTLGKGDLTAAQVARVLIGTGHLLNQGNPGLRFRTFMRAQAWTAAPTGGRYVLTAGEARRIASAFIAAHAPTTEDVA